MTAGLFPEIAETGLQLLLHAHVGICIVTVVRHSIDMHKAERFRDFLRHVKDEILRTIGVTTASNFFDQILRVLYIRPLHRTDPERHVSFFIWRYPEHDPVKHDIIQMQYNGKKSFFPFPWIEGKLKAQTSDFILPFPMRVWFLPIKPICCSKIFARSSKVDLL